MHCSSVTSKGQVTIPIDFRQEMGITPKDKVEFVKVGNMFTFQKKRKIGLMDLSGSLPKPKRSFTIEEMDEGMAKAIAKARAPK